jgi:hypothetical protein
LPRERIAERARGRIGLLYYELRRISLLLDFSHSSRVANCVGQPLEELTLDFYRVGR